MRRLIEIATERRVTIVMMMVAIVAGCSGDERQLDELGLKTK